MEKKRNLWVIPTDKPSRLYYSGNNSELLFSKTLVSFRTFDRSTQHIYITSDEEIKEGVNQWYLDKFLNKPYSSGGAQYGEKQNVIILTTDQDLIKDGVQAIDDEFLEWFVKNPSCEEVDVKEDKKLSSKSIYDAVEGDLVYSHHGYGGIINSLSKDIRVGIDNYVETAITSETGWETLDINNYQIYDKYYKIIFPKKEPEQELDCPYDFTSRCTMGRCDCKPKQEHSKYLSCCKSLEECHCGKNKETLEEAARNYRDLKLPDDLYDGFIAGTKWQAERMYSEEEVVSILIKAYEDIGKRKIPNQVVLASWFEQFKKK